MQSLAPSTTLFGAVAGVCIFLYSNWWSNGSDDTTSQKPLRLAPPIRVADGTHQATIATGRGDTGVTSLFDGSIASKADDTFEAIGAIDELSASIGLIHAADSSEMLRTIQKQLTVVMGVLATPQQTDFRTTQVSEIIEMTDQINTLMNSYDSQLPPLREFILPSGNELSVRTHVARAVCRRAERAAVRISAEPAVIQCLNRLSDLLFTLARWYASEDDRVPRRT